VSKICTSQLSFSLDNIHRRKVFPCFDPLTAYLLASDVSYTNVIPRATPIEVGHIVHLIGKGSFKEMIKLELIDNDGDAHNTALAYAKLYQYLCNKLTDDFKERIGFDVYSPEYALCKRSHLAHFVKP
jgi:hypothetical protein